MLNKVKRSNPLMWLIDPLQPTAGSASEAYRFKWTPVAWLLPLGIGVAGLTVSAVSWVTDPEQFYFAYLIGWSFCLSLAVGALFFVLIQHLTRAYWSVVVRRISESLLWTFPLLVILGIPLLFGLHDLYHWTHADVMDPASPAFDEVLAGKQLYLNVPFFLGRLIFYFLIWSFISFRLYTLSVRQDVSGGEEVGVRQRNVSSWGLAITAITTSFASFDILMSLEPHWFSTIFGVYFFSGSFMSVMAVMVLVAMVLQKAGMLTSVITTEHYQDLGKFLFGFIVFWAYIAFSQYMLIWYGNLPEETVFYRARFENGWGLSSSILLVGHFIIPFTILVSRTAKRVLPVLAFMCVWILVMQWFDFFWIVMPVLHEEAAFHFVDLTAWIGLTGVIFASVMYRLSRHSLVPERDPQLSRSLSFTNS
jgi:hypothetical protein